MVRELRERKERSIGKERLRTAGYNKSREEGNKE